MNTLLFSNILIPSISCKTYNNHEWWCGMKFLLLPLWEPRGGEAVPLLPHRQRDHHAPGEPGGGQQRRTLWLGAQTPARPHDPTLWGPPRLSVSYVKLLLLLFKGIMQDPIPKNINTQNIGIFRNYINTPGTYTPAWLPVLPLSYHYYSWSFDLYI